jgi:hypothetical protein
MGLTSTTGMKMSTYNKVVERLVEITEEHKKIEEERMAAIAAEDAANAAKNRNSAADEE